VVVADFGVSEEIDPNDNKAGLLGTFNWMPPEVWRTTKKEDTFDLIPHRHSIRECMTPEVMSSLMEWFSGRC